MSSTVKPLAPKRSGRFSYGDCGFTVKGHGRVGATRLRELLFPDEIKRRRKGEQNWARKNAEEEAKGTVKKDWLIAQLTHYDIKIDSDATVGNMRELLERSVKEGKCDLVPQNIQDIEVRLAPRYDKENVPHMARERKRVDALIAEENRTRKEAFEKLATPAEEAAFDLTMFMRKYFLDDRGQPDPLKTRKPIALHGYSARSTMHAAAGGVSGLETTSGGQGEARTLVIGWDRSAVWREAAKISNIQSAQRAKEEATGWEELMKEHRAFVKTLPAIASKQAFSIEQAQGSYIVAGAKMVSAYAQSEELTLDITQGRDGWVGLFDFGVIEGIMRFDVDKEALVTKNDELDEDIGDNEDEGDDRDDDVRTSKRRLLSSNKRKEHPTSARTATKRAKSASSKPDRRLYLKWRGRETGEGVIQLDSDNRNVGHLVFLDAKCTKFEGCMSVGFLGENVPFQGYQVGSEVGPVTKSWSDYSERAYEAARVGRWGRSSRW